MQANIITLTRIVLVFFVVAFFQINSVYTRLFATVLAVFVIYMDSLDGYVARKLKISSDFGALFDITGDRIIENVFWIYYSWAGVISYWVPIIVISRGFLVDSVRTVAFQKGQTAFGKKTMMKSEFTKFLVASPFSRTLYGLLKIVIFTLIGAYITVRTGVVKAGWNVDAQAIFNMKFCINVLVDLTVAMCIIRALPVLWDGRDVLFQKEYPKDAREQVK